MVPGPSNKHPLLTINNFNQANLQKTPQCKWDLTRDTEYSSELLIHLVVCTCIVDIRSGLTCDYLTPTYYEHKQ